MMINKRLISMMGDSKRYIAWNVVLQFLALLANIVMIFAVSLFLTGLVRREPDLPTALLYILGALIVRFFCTRGAASASYNASCTVKKTLRAAISSIDKGQWEAAASIGMTPWQTMRRAILPQAARVALPPLSNSFISLVKDTSLAATIQVPELFRQAQLITSRTLEVFTMYLAASLIYWIMATVLSTLQNHFENQLNRQEREPK